MTDVQKNPASAGFFVSADICLMQARAFGVVRFCQSACEGVSLAASVCQRRIARAGIQRQSAMQSHAVGFLVALFSQLFTVLPDDVDCTGHD